MVKMLILILAFTLALAGCVEHKPCMAENESGVVIDARTETTQGRGGPYNRAVFIIKMSNGVSRACDIYGETATIIPLGTKVNLPYARRSY